jgi:RHS repeat-associated protein
VDSTGRESGLGFIRHYNSLLANDMGFGMGWTTAFNKRLVIIGGSVQVQSGNGRGETFVCYGGVCTGDAETKLQLTSDATGYTLTHRDKSTERYDLTGKLLSETDSAGRPTNYSYGANTTTVTDFFGHTLTLGYNASNHVATVTDSAGLIIGYSYDTNNNLVRVDYPDTTAKLYHYNETNLTSGANLPNHLTGISYVDSSGVTTRYGTYAYDAAGKAIRTEHADVGNGAQEKFLLNYNTDTQTTVTDPVNTQNVMIFAVNLGIKNLVSKTSSIDTKSLQQTFDLNNNMTCRKDEENHVTLYSYNNTNQKLSTTEGLSGTDCNTCLSNPATCNVGGVGRVTTYEYVSTTLDLPRFIRRPSVATGQTFETEIQYGDATHPNLPTSILQRGYTPLGASVSRSVGLSYNANGQVNSINGPRTDVNDITTLEYNDCNTGNGCGQVKRVINALNHITTYDNYDPNGRLLQMTDPNGLRTNYTYDPRGRVKTITQTPISGSAVITQYSYTAWGDVSQVIDPDGVVMNYQYDAAHYLRYIVDAAGNYLYYTYDLKGNRTGDYTYDASNVLKRGVGKAYDLRNHLSQINLAGNTTQLVYDAVGNLRQETDPNLRTTTRTPDALNRLITSLDALSGTTGYSYDMNDRPVVVTAPNNLTTQYSYDDLGSLLSETSPDRGKTTYTYDTAGNVLTAKDARNIITTYTYDALNRAASKQSSNTSTPSYTYNYDSCYRGRLCSVSRNGPSHLLLGYDGFGRVNFQLDLSTGFYSNYVYTPGNRIAQIGYPSDRTVDYQYDTLGRISQVSTAANGVTTILAQNFQHYSFGPISNFTFGNGQAYAVTLDQAYRPTTQQTGPRQKTASYDPAGNLYKLDDVSATQTFTYDPVNALTSAIDTQPGGYGSLSYLYNPNGNRSSETRNGSTSAYTYNKNRLQDNESQYWLYDAAGNATWSNYAYVTGYDGYGRMTSTLSGAATYAYNAFDQRTRKTAGGVTTRFYYGLAGELLYEGQGANTKAYVYLNGMPLSRVDNDSNVYYYHTDHLGTPQAMTDASGTMVWKASYEPFGKATITVSTITNNLRLDGYWDQEVNLSYNGARYRDLNSNRFLSSDPIGLAGGLNTYVAVGNNPLRWTDPTGLAVFLCQRSADLPFPLNQFDHYWIKTDTFEAGMGGMRGGVPGQNGNSDRPYDPTQTVDHSGQSKASNASCEKQRNVDEQCVNDLIRPGQSTGGWNPYNQCQSFAYSTVNRCRTGPQIPPSK